MVRLTRRQFLRLVQQAYEALPDNVTKALQNLEVVVERWPAATFWTTWEMSARTSFSASILASHCQTGGANCLNCRT